MKKTLFAAIAVLALTNTGAAFADQAHRDATAAGARGDWRTNATNGAGSKQYLAAIDAQDMARIAPRVALSDRAAIS